ncbi:MAG TPA: PKD domain-containing protein [Gaiellaceae bacterium]|jgi:hypothetical protein
MTRAAAEATLGRPKVTWAYDSRGNLVPGVIDGGEPFVTMRYARGIVLSWAAADLPRGRCPYPATSARRSRARLNAWVQCALRLIPAGARVEQVDATTAAERTATGVGVGSTFAQAKRGLPSAVCRSGRARSLCFVMPTAPVRTQTRFLLEHGRVTAVEMQGSGACRPQDGCKAAGGGSDGGRGSGRPSPPPKVEKIECIPNPISLADGGLVECGADVGGVSPDTDVASISWDYGDGSPATDFYEHEYEAAGTYTVGVVVVAKDGRRASGSIVVTVTP